MRKQILALTLGLLSIATFAQKKEIRAAEKALKKNNFKEAKAIIGKLEANEAAIEEKYKAQYYFVKAGAYGKSNVDKAAAAYNKLFELEKASRKLKYTKEAQPKFNALKERIVKLGLSSYETKNYKKAIETFYLRYSLAKKDTLFLSNAALIAFQSKDYNKSLEYYKELQKLGYTGIETLYLATNKDGKVVNLGAKSQRDLYVRSGGYTNPKDSVTKSKKVLINKNIALSLKELGKVKEAIEAMEEARRENPKDLNLLLTFAYVYNDLKQMDKFGELMEEAIKLDPNNPILYFNLGIANRTVKKIEEAKKYYLKAIELKPDYVDAYMELSATIAQEASTIEKEMNKLPMSEEKKYNELNERRKEVLKKALPYLEKADTLKRTFDTVKVLLNFYDIIGLTEKADALRPLYKKMRDKQ